MTIERFGSLNGQDVLQVSLEGPDGMEAKILTWGAVVRDLVVPLAGGSQRVVLGLNSIEDYVAHSPYLGAIVGRISYESCRKAAPRLARRLYEAHRKRRPQLDTIRVC